MFETICFRDAEFAEFSLSLFCSMFHFARSWILSYGRNLFSTGPVSIVISSLCDCIILSMGTLFFLSDCAKVMFNNAAVGTLL